MSVLDTVRNASSPTLNGVFQRSFTVFADRVAVTSEDSSMTYAELGARSRQLAAALHARGIGRGSRVAVLSETRPEYVEVYAALASLGATALTLNIRLHPEEIKFCIDAGAPSAVITSGGFAHLLEPSRTAGNTENGGIEHWIALDPTDAFDDYSALFTGDHPEPDLPEVTADDIHNVLYTSGTTGRPKGAMISQGAAAIRALRLAQWFALTPDDGFIGWLPLFHCGGDESLYATLMTGGTYATFSKADPETMFKVIERDRLTWTLLLPGVLTDFLHHPRRTDFDLSSFRFAIGYANMMPAAVQELTRECDIDFYDAFGQTESSYLLAHGVSGPDEVPSLRKMPAPLMELRIVDADMRDQPAGTPGECVVRGPSVMSGYLDDEAATAEAFAGGWLHTGDLMLRNDDGTVSYVDRKKYLIKTGGENVYPAEVEQVISGLAGVQEVAVFGVPHDRWGEAVSAVVVRLPGADLTEQQVIDHCRANLATYKRPLSVKFLTEEELPRSTTGKLQRHVLSQGAAEQKGHA